MGIGRGGRHERSQSRLGARLGRRCFIPLGSSNFTSPYEMRASVAADPHYAQVRIQSRLLSLRFADIHSFSLLRAMRASVRRHRPRTGCFSEIPLHHGFHQSRLALPNTLPWYPDTHALRLACLSTSACFLGLILRFPFVSRLGYSFKSLMDR